MKAALRLALLVVVGIGALLLQRARSTEAPSSRAPAPAERASDREALAELPREARETIARIRAGGAFDHRQDGAVFQNREGRLPSQPRGYYHEYTVETPGSDDRGARRIVTGGDPPHEIFYTGDHYRTFQRVTP